MDCGKWLSLWCHRSNYIYFNIKYMQFQHEHPGGSSILLNSGGKDSTVKFNEINHSLNA
jgi:cytochrome b involved in lipid metabolism